MSVFTRRRTWQPQHPVNVDWGNPITLGIRFLWTPSTSYGFDSVSRAIPSDIGGGTVDASVNGKAYSAVAGSGNGLSFGSYTPIPQGSTNYTIISLAKPVSGTGSRNSFFTSGSDGSSPWRQFALLANANTTVYNSGGFAFQEFDTSLMAGAASANTAINGGWHLFGGQRTGNTYTVYLDGADATSTTGGTNGTAGALSGGCFVSGASGSSRAGVFPNALVAVWNRSLKKEEHAQLAANPWQLFAPARKVLYFGGAAATSYTLTAAQGSFTLTGNAASLIKGNVLLSTTATFTETGNAANLVKASVLATVSGAFTEIGNATNLTKQWALVADVGSFVFTGNDATLSYSGNVHPPLTAATGSYTLTGNAAGLSHGYVLTADAASYTLTGNAATLRNGKAVVTDTGAFTLTGNDATLTKTYVLTVDKGTFILTGRNANLIWSGAPGVSVTFWTGVSKMNNSESSGGVSEKSHDISGGPSVYTVTETSAVSSDKKDSVSYVGYDHA